MKMSNLPGSGFIPRKEKEEEYTLPTLEKLNKHSKKKLSDEVVRLQKIVRQALVFIGKRRATPSSELIIDMHFVSHVIQLLEMSEQENLQ